jgi:hypothetical protein
MATGISRPGTGLLFLMYERIVRQLTGRNAFALPYWDWTNNRQLPAADFSGARRFGLPVIKSIIAGHWSWSKIFPAISDLMRQARLPSSASQMRSPPKGGLNRVFLLVELVVNERIFIAVTSDQYKPRRGHRFGSLLS